MLHAKKNVPLGSNAQQPSSKGEPAIWFAHFARHLLLVPEAGVLVGLLCAHSALGPSPVFALGAVAVALYFATRTALLALGHQALTNANYKRAQRLAQIAAWLHPASADAHALCGAIHMARGEVELAVPVLAQAVALFPLQAELHTTLSAALLENSRPQEARAAALAALALKPCSPMARLHLAGAEEQLGAPSAQVEAQLRAGLALASAPAERAALDCALAELLLTSGRGAEAAPALASAEQMLEACPTAQRAGLHFYLGELLKLSGESSRAQAHFSASETIDPEGRYAAAAWRAARS